MLQEVGVRMCVGGEVEIMDSWGKVAGGQHQGRSLQLQAFSKVSKWSC